MRAGKNVAAIGVAVATVLATNIGAGATAPTEPSVLVAPGVSRTFTVNSVADRSDARRDGVCATAQASECTLRAAMQEANAAGGPVTIAFNIPGAGMHKIALASELPGLSNAHFGVTIDGFSQPGAAPNTDPVADNAKRTIEIAGKGPSGFEGIVIASAGNTIRGVNIHSFRRAFVMRQQSAASNTMVGDLIGLLPDGSLDVGFHYVAGSSCVEIAGGAHDNVVGAPGNANRNTIGGCSHHGIATYNFPTTRNTIQNNIIGLDPTGTKKRGNQGYGIDINTATTRTLVGGTGPGEHNVISGNGGNGTEISHMPGTMYNSIVGNYIGTNLTATAVSAVTSNFAAGVHLEGRGNCHNTPCPADENHNSVTDNVIANSGGPGVLIDKGAHDNLVARNRIGILPNGTHAPNEVGVFIEAGAFANTIGPGNEIAFNTNAIELQPTLLAPPSKVSQPTNFNRFTQNIIHDNTKALAIDLAPFNTPNTNVGTADTNEGVRTPTVAVATRATVSITTCAGCTVELFLSSRGAGLSGQGKAYLATAVASSGGVATIRTPSIAFGHTVTATTSTPKHSTSEFSIGAWVR